MRKTLFLIAFVAVFTGAKAQIIHVKGIKSIELGYGINRLGAEYYGGFVNYFSRKMYGKASLFYGEYKDGMVEFTRMGLDVQAAYTLYQFKNRIYLNVDGGLTIGADEVSNGEKYGLSRKIKYGALIGFESEIFITDKFVFIINYNQKYMMNKDYGNNRYIIRSGIRYNF